MTPRVVVLSLAYRPTQRVQEYLSDLISVGVDVDLLVAERSSLDEVELDPRIRVRRVLDAEADTPIRKFENRLVFALPGKLVGGARALTRRPLAKVQRAQETFSRGVHYKVFWPAYKVVRPWLLVRRSRPRLAELDLAGADRIVAADVPALPLGWRLARKYPDVRATASLDRRPYAD